MKKIILILGFSLFVSSVKAEVSIVSIHEAGTLSKDHVALFLENGEIVHIDKNDTALVTQVKKIFATHKKIQLTRVSQNLNHPDLVVAVEVSSDDLSTINSANKEMYSPERFSTVGFTTNNPLEKANITILSTYQEAQTIMDKLRRDTGDESQCYNRAHVWTYETLANSQVTLGKTWIFFTQKYIREFEYKWWFHVAPHATVNDANQTYILDRGFTTVPHNLVNWKNIFMRNQAECPVITNYLDYDNNQDTSYCYLMFSSQYYWQPYQLKNLAANASRSRGYRRANLPIAYTDAIANWDRQIPVLAGAPEDERETPETRTSDNRASHRDWPVVRPEPRVETPNYYPALRVRFSKGAEVIDESYRAGEIIGIIDQDEVLIQYNNSRETAVKHVSYLGLRVESFLTFRNGTEIIDEQNKLGEIRKLYSNGVALIDYDSYSDGYVRLSNRIGYETRQLRGFTRGQSIIDSSNSTGHINRLFSNGFFLFDKDGTSTNYISSIAEISYEVSTLRGYRSGTKVIYGDATGKVKTLFANGQILVDFDNYRDSFVSVDQLAMEVSSSLGFARGNRVLFRGNLLAEIKRVYSDGRAYIDFNERGYADALVAIAELRRVR